MIKKSKKLEPKMISRHTHERTVNMLHKQFFQIHEQSKKDYENAIIDIDIIFKQKHKLQVEINKLTRVISNLHEVINILGEEITERPYTNPPYKMLADAIGYLGKVTTNANEEKTTKNKMFDEAIGNKKEMIKEIKANVEAKIRKRRTNKSSTKKSN